MNFQILIVLVLGMQAAVATHAHNSKFSCPKMNNETLTKSCSVCVLALTTKSAHFRVRAACSVLARYQCCPSIELMNTDGLAIKIARVSAQKLHLFKSLHLI